MNRPLRRLLPLLLPVLCTAIVAIDAAAELPPTASLQPIFNGTDLSGWRVAGAEYWSVKDGLLVGESDAAKKGSMLYTEKAYGDVIVEGEVRFDGEIDSGFMLRKLEVQVQIGVSRSL